MARLSIRTYPIRFAANEKNLRETWGLSEEDMAEIAGVQAATVTEWEEQKLVPPLDIVSRIGSYFDVHPAVLLWGDEVRSENTPTIQMGMLSENDYKELLAMRDKNCGTLVLTENEMDVVRAFRHLSSGGRQFLRKLLNQRLRQEERIREQL